MWVLGLVGERHMITRSLCREGGWSESFRDGAALVT